MFFVFDVSAFSSSSASCFCKSAILPYFSSASLLRSYSRSALSISFEHCSISSRSFCTLEIADFSFSHLAFISLNCSRISESSFCTSWRCSTASLSVSFLRTVSSISCWSILRLISSSSVGIESISVLISAQASSTRSIALSGRNLSVIYLFERTAAAISA